MKDKMWFTKRQNILEYFPSPYSDDNDAYLNVITSAIKKLLSLKHPSGDDRAYIGKSPELKIDFENIKKAKVPQVSPGFQNTVNELVEMFDGLPHWGSPLTMMNIIPQASTISIIASIFAMLYAPNILEGEYAWNVHKAELECAGMLGNLFGWDSLKTGCLFTYGGGGCWNYAVKYAITRVLRNSRHEGVRVNGKVLCSEQAHFTVLNSTDWTGLGMDNIIRIPDDDKTNAMNLNALEEVLKDLKSKNIPVIAVTCTMGTTDANAFDPIVGVRKLLDKYPNDPTKYGPTLLYADAVIGWSWTVFKSYDFEKNPMEFSPTALAEIKNCVECVKGIEVADAAGVDFHKTGWSPYAASCFVYKNASEFEKILERPGSVYLQPRSPYNPLDYSLECSRSAQGSLAGWATLKFFGIEGLQSLIGGLIENQVHLRNAIASRKNMVCVNKFDSSLVTLVRIYPEGVDAKAEYVKELDDPKYISTLVKNNKNIHKIGDILWNWFRSNKKINGKYTPYMSFSTGFRTTNYNTGKEKNPDAYVFALKIFPVNTFVTKEVLDHVLDCVEAAAKEVF